MSVSSTSEQRRLSKPQRGSAFVAVLLLIVVLSMIGITLVLTTQTERRIGANERTGERNFYSADAALRLGLMKFMALKDYRPLRLDTVEPVMVDGVTRSGIVQARDLDGNLRQMGIETRIDVSAIYPINNSRSSLGMINQGSLFYNINHAVVARSTRILPRPNGVGLPPIQSTKQLSVMFMADPLQAPNAQALATIDTNELSNKF